MTSAPLSGRTKDRASAGMGYRSCSFWPRRWAPWPLPLSDGQCSWRIRLGENRWRLLPSILRPLPSVKPQKPEPAVSQQGTGASRDGNDGAGNEPPAVALPPSRTVTIIDGTSGQRREIVIPGPADSPGREPSAAARPARGALPKAAPDGRPSARTISVP
jgi:hypothetical protein